MKIGNKKIKITLKTLDFVLFIKVLNVKKIIYNLTSSYNYDHS